MIHKEITMNWEAIGAIGEILGATVVFITLVYLAIQVKHAKVSAADANRLARTRGVTDMQLAQLIIERLSPQL